MKITLIVTSHTRRLNWGFLRNLPCFDLELMVLGQTDRLECLQHCRLEESRHGNLKFTNYGENEYPDF